MRMHFTFQWAGKTRRYRTVEAAVLKVVAIMRSLMQEKRKAQEIVVLNGSSHACRVLLADSEICVHYLN